MAANIDSLDIYQPEQKESMSSFRSSSSNAAAAAATSFSFDEESGGRRFTVGTGANEDSLLRRDVSPSSAFAEEDGTVVARPAADEKALLRHGVDPASCLPGDDKSSSAPSSVPSPPPSHIGSINFENEEVVVDGANGTRSSSSSSGSRTKEARKRYALVAFIGVLLVVIIALAAVLGTSAARGREAEAQYQNQYSAAQGPPEGVDVSSEGGDGPPENAPEAPAGGYQDYGEDAGDAADGLFQGDQEEEPEAVAEDEEFTSVDVEEALVAAEVEELVYSTDQAEVELPSPSLTSSTVGPTGSPTGPPPAPEEDEDDEEGGLLETWNDHWEEGRCFDGFDEAFCCILFMCR